MASRVIVVGLGGRGRDWVRTVRAHPRFELAAGVEVDAGVLGDAAKALGLPLRHYRPYDEMSPSLVRLPDHLLWQSAVHDLDTLRFVIAREAIAVMAHSFALPWAPGAPGSSLQALIEFEGGIRATYCGSYHTRGHEFFERGQEFYQRFVGERGTMHVFHRWILVCERGRLPRLVRRGPRPYTEERLLLDQLDEALGRGREPESSGRDNLNTIALLEACAISAAERRWVRPRDLLDARS